MCIHELILKRLYERGLISFGNITEQIKEIKAEALLAQKQDVRDEVEANHIVASLTPAELEMFEKEFKNGSIIH